MYKGKFDQKGKQSGADVEELLAQRAAEQQRQAQQARRAAQKSASPRTGTPQKPKAVSSHPAPANIPQKQTAAPKKKGPRLGGVIFYTLYFLFILVFFIATYIGMQWVNGWLLDYQAAQPDVKAEQVFTQLFTNPDWDALYVASGVQDSPFEGKEQFVTYMNGKVDPSQLTYLETSAGLSGGKKYVVRMGDTQVATFTLTDRSEQNTAESGLDKFTHVPDWELGAVEVFFQREGTYRIRKQDNHTALLNGVTVSDDYTIQVASTKADAYLPAGTKGNSICLQEITGLMEKPTVEIFDETGAQMEVSYDEDTQTFSEGLQGSTIDVQEKTAALGAAESYCKWMIEELTDRGALAKYYEPTSDAYKTIASMTPDKLWAQDNDGFQFLNEEITDFVRYSDTLFSCRVTLTMEVKVRLDGSTKTFNYAQSLFFSKNDSGNWLCYAATNEDVSQPVGKVRLTFMQGETLLLSDLFETESKQIITPMITAPEGKVFSGWVRREEADGKTTLTLVFQPDSSGVVDIPEGNSLTPMTLYALFEDEGAVQPVETDIPDTTPTTEGA